MMELPLGFGMALAQNEAAMHVFEAMTDAEKQAWNAKSDFSGSFFELKDYPEYGVVSYVGYAGGTVTIIGCQEDGSRQIYGYDILPNTNTAADGAFLRARNGSVTWETLTNVAEEGA